MTDQNPWASPPEPTPEDPQPNPPAQGLPPAQSPPPPGPPPQPQPGYPQQPYPPQGYPPGAPPQTNPQPGYPQAGYQGPPPYGYQGYTGYAYPMGPRTSGRATAVLILGIASVVSWCFYGVGIVPAIVALALAPGAKREIRSSGGMINGESQVKAGVICACIALVLSILAIIALAIFIIWAANQPSYPHRTGTVY